MANSSGLADFLRAIELVQYGRMAEPRGRGEVKVGPRPMQELQALNQFMAEARLGAHSHAKLFKILGMMSAKLQAHRCSFVEIVSEDSARVLASSDDASVMNRLLELKKYPELRALARTKASCFIANVSTSKLLKELGPAIDHVNCQSMLLFPIFRGGRLYGALCIRMPLASPHDLMYAERYGAVCSQVLTMSLAA